MNYFSWTNRLFRVCWLLAEVSMFRLSPVPLFAWRSSILRLFGAKVGKSCRFYPTVRIWAPWNLRVSDNVTVGPRANLYSMAIIEIGDKAVISQDVDLVAGSHDYTRVDLHPALPLVASPIAIGDKCWICSQVFILPGVTVGSGAVIGARSVVTRDQPAWMVCAGHPCQPIKPRI